MEGNWLIMYRFTGEKEWKCIEVGGHKLIDQLNKIVGWGVDNIKLYKMIKE